MILIFNEMYIQNSEEFVGGKIVGAFNDDKFYKWIMSYRTVRLMCSIQYNFKVLLETKITAKLLTEENGSALINFMKVDSVSCCCLW